MPDQSVFGGYVADIFALSINFLIHRYNYMMLNNFYSFFTFACLMLFNTAFALDFSHLDPDKIVPQKILSSALDYYEKNLDSIPNKRFIGLIDFKQHNSKERFYIVDMESGRVETHLVAHGKNSDPDFDGFATKFSNTPDSLQSSLGFYLTAETYIGAHGYSLRLDGLSRTNSNARDRAIVIHAAEYVAPGGKIGRSFGCPAIDVRIHAQLIDQIKDGSLLYASY